MPPLARVRMLEQELRSQRREAKRLIRAAEQRHEHDVAALEHEVVALREQCSSLTEECETLKGDLNDFEEEMASEREEHADMYVLHT